MQVGLHCAEGQVHDVSDLFVGVAFDVPQNDDRPVLFAEPPDRMLDLASELPVLHVFLWIFVSRFDHDLTLTDLVGRSRVRRTIDRDGVELPFPQVIDRVVVRDLQDPVTELVAGLVGADRVEGANERFLRQIFGERTVPYHPEDERENRSFITRQQLTERSLVSTCGARREFAVFQRRVVLSSQRSLVLP